MSMLDSVEPTRAPDRPRAAAAVVADLPAPAESVRGQHVVIVGINYWPEPTGIAPYTTQIAEHLARSAASVTVVTGLPCYPSWTVADGYRRRLRIRQQRHGVNIVRLAHHVPSKQSALRRGAYEASFLAHAAAVRLPNRPDVVLAVTPALGGAVAGRVLARRHGARFAVIVQDLMAKAASQSGIAGGGAVSGITARMEGAALRAADAVAVVSEAFAPQVAEYGVDPDRLALLRNWTHVPAPRRSREQVRAALGWPEGVTIALHSGNMGLKQDLGNIVEAARCSHDVPNLRWVLMGDGSQRPQLEQQMAGLANISLLDPVDLDEYTDVLHAADILLVNERPSVGDMSLPSKLTSYFMTGRPVVAAVSLAGATAAEINRSDAAVAVPAGQPDALVEAVDALAAAPLWATRLGENGRGYAASHLSMAAAMSAVDGLLADPGSEAQPDGTPPANA